MSKFYSQDSNNIEIDSDDDINERTSYLRDNFTLEDFLDFDKTREILEQNNLWDFEKNCEGLLERFFKAEVNYCQKDMSTLFNNEINYAHLGIFQAIVFNYVKPKYDVEVLYDNPSLCRSFIEHHGDKSAEEEKERLEEQRENYKKTSNAGKIFNWSSKSYKEL